MHIYSGTEINISACCVDVLSVHTLIAILGRSQQEVTYHNVSLVLRTVVFGSQNF